MPAHQMHRTIHRPRHHARSRSRNHQNAATIPDVRVQYWQDIRTHGHPRRARRPTQAHSQFSRIITLPCARDSRDEML